MKGHAVPYTDEELTWIEARKRTPRRELHADFIVKFSRNDVSLDNFKSLCKRKGWFTGRSGRFPTGHTPANKGKKMPFNANSARTQFKKGELHGQAKKQFKPIGTERITKDGYLERKINNGSPRDKRWRAVHLIEWEMKNGCVPKGHALKCLDGNRQNCDPDNWVAIPRGMLPRLSGLSGPKYDDAPSELKPTILATAKLENKIREAWTHDKA